MNKFLYALRSIGLTIVGVVIAVLVHFGPSPCCLRLFLYDLCLIVGLLAADWSRYELTIMESYMAANPFASLQHAYRPFLWVCPRCILVRARHQTSPSWRTEKRNQAAYTGAVVLLALWIWGDVQNDLYDVPVGVLWTTIDVWSSLLHSTGLGLCNCWRLA